MSSPRDSWSPSGQIALENWQDWNHLNLVEGGMEQVAKAHCRKGDLEGGVQDKGLGLDQQCLRFEWIYSALQELWVVF